MSYTMGDPFSHESVHTEHKTCEHEAELPVIGAQLRAAHALLMQRYSARPLASGADQAERKLAESVIRQVGTAITAPPMLGVCPFDGDVDVSYDPHGSTIWECPTCDWTHEDE